MKVSRRAGKGQEALPMPHWSWLAGEVGFRGPQTCPTSHDGRDRTGKGGTARDGTAQRRSCDHGNRLASLERHENATFRPP